LKSFGRVLVREDCWKCLTEFACLRNERNRESNTMQMQGLIHLSVDVCFPLRAARWCNTFWHVDTSASLSWDIQLTWRTDVWLERHENATRL
jgi:hypothetical protein